MAKRRAAEPLAFHVPWKRPFYDLSAPEEQPPPAAPLWLPPHPELSRKRRIDAGAMADPSASPNKRRDSGDGSGPGDGEEEPEDRSLEPGEPSPLRPAPEEEPCPARPLRGGGGDDGAGRAGSPRGAWGAAALQHSEDFWQYNTFQYWRTPLPPVELADITDASEARLAEAAGQDRDGAAEVDMES